MDKSLLITIDFSPNVGGVARYLDGYARVNKIDVLAPKNKEQLSIFGDSGLKIIRKKLLWRWWPKWLPLLFWGCHYSRRYDNLVISHILPVGYVALLCRKPYTLILHGLDILNAGKSRRKRYWAKKILDKAEKIVVNSKATGELLRTVFGDLYNYEIFYPLISPLPKAQKNLKEEYGLENKKIILSLGRLIKRKGQEKIIKLMPRILKEDKNAFFVIAGDGEYKEKLKELVKELKLEDKVMFLGRVPEAELANLYQMCDIFVLPALPSKDNWEGFGMVCLEAAYYSKPVVVTRVGGVAESVEDGVTGFVVRDDEELYSRLLELLKDKSLRFALGDEGRARVEQEFLIKNS